MLTCNNVSLVIAGKKLIFDMSFTIFPYSITYLKGGNGSGKSSLLRALAGIIDIDEGSIEYSDFISEGDIIYIGHSLALKNNITVKEQLEFWGNLYNSHELLPAVAHFWQLGNILDEKIQHLSAGNQKKVALSRSMCTFSNLWLLDEVDTNLDEENRHLLSNAVQSKAASGGLVFIATHGKDYIPNSQIISLSDFAPHEYMSHKNHLNAYEKNA